MRTPITKPTYVVRTSNFFKEKLQFYYCTVLWYEIITVQKVSICFVTYKRYITTFLPELYFVERIRIYTLYRYTHLRTDNEMNITRVSKRHSNNTHISCTKCLKKPWGNALSLFCTTNGPSLDTKYPSRYSLLGKKSSESEVCVVRPVTSNQLRPTSKIYAVKSFVKFSL